MSPTSSPATASLPSDIRAGVEGARIAALARAASVEMTWHDVPQLDACRRLLIPGSSVYVSHIPGLSWEQSIATCAAVRSAGLEPVPHVPARELSDVAELRGLLQALVAQAGVQQLLLIAGDRDRPVGAFSQALDLIVSGELARAGIRRIAVAAHPEGHPRIAEGELRRVEREKLARAAERGIELAFVTQFFFESAPFLAWLRALRAGGVRAPVIAGLAGPARLSTLFKYALRCGVGASLRALGSRPSSIAGLIGERGPELLVREIARAAADDQLAPMGLHLYAFGGLTRTCAWIDAVARGRFELGESGFALAEPLP
jgi:methylenetetrahydrofolate reductase (NADPH)